MNTINPFPTTAYLGPEYFCDREEELEQLRRNAHGGNSTTLIALRRLGKTALIRHLFNKLEKEFICIYMDILPTESLEQLMNSFVTAVSQSIPEKSRAGKKVWSFIKSLRPVISYDTLAGNPMISIKANPEESKRTITELFSVLEAQSKPVLIAIDEFQQILNYPEQQSDAWLRSIMQQLGNIRFIFSGSQQHLMQDMFANPSRPFFRSSQFIKVGRIESQLYREFIISTFARHKKTLPEEVADEMLDWTDNYTYYVQLLCNRVFMTPLKKITTETWKHEANKLLKEQEFMFYNYREMLTKPQWKLLKAIAFEGKVFQPTSFEFTSRHQLGNPATVLRSLGALDRMELIYSERDLSGKKYYGIYDLLFQRWVEGHRI